MKSSSSENTDASIILPACANPPVPKIQLSDVIMFSSKNFNRFDPFGPAKKPFYVKGIWWTFKILYFSEFKKVNHIERCSYLRYGFNGLFPSNFTSR